MGFFGFDVIFVNEIFPKRAFLKRLSATENNPGCRQKCYSFSLDEVIEYCIVSISILDLFELTLFKICFGAFYQFCPLTKSYLMKVQYRNTFFSSIYPPHCMKAFLSFLPIRFFYSFMPF